MVKKFEDKIGYNSACVKDISRSLHLTGSSWGRAVEWC